MYFFSQNADFALLLARIVLGITMVYYGLPKIRDLRANAKDFSETKGFRPGWIWGTIVAFLEFFGGIAMVAGLFWGWIAMAVGFEMLLGTIWKIKVGKPFTNYSYDIQLLVICLLILAFGGGAYTITTF